MRLHLEQPRLGPCEFEPQPLALVEIDDLSLGRDDELDIAVVEFINQADKASRRIFVAAGEATDVTDQYCVKYP